MPSATPPILAPCGSRPNCVSSHSLDAGHRVEPLAFSGPAEVAEKRLKRAIATLPRTRVVAERPGYLHVECRSWLFRFVDDLELVIGAGRIEVRSAARTGYSDMGVNRRRVERLRAAFVAVE